MGKTIVGQLVAERLGYPLIDMGTMYRALTAKAIEAAKAIAERVSRVLSLVRET